MAAEQVQPENQSALTSKPKPKEFSKEDIACTICLDRLKEPKLLPCFHTYCKACLEGLLRKSPENKQITCPQCRSIHSLPNGGVGGFSDDRVLENALDFHSFKESQEKDVSLSCSMCTEDDPAIAHCSTCSKFLCDFCGKAHRRLVNFRDHKVLALDQLSSEAMRLLERPRYCAHHPEEVLKLYCNTCQELICRDCSIVEHRDHKFDFSKGIRPKVQQDIEQAMKHVIAKQQEFQTHLAFIKDAEKTREGYSEALTKQVNQEFDSFVAILESRRKQLLEQEEKSRAADMKQIWAQKQSIEMTLASMASGLSYSERLCECPSDTDTLAMSSDARKRLVSLQNMQWNPNSYLRCSPPLVFVSKSQKYLLQTAHLKAIGDSLSVQALEPVQSRQQVRAFGVLTPEPVETLGQVQASLPVQALGPDTIVSTVSVIGQKVQLLIQVQATNSTTNTSWGEIMQPSISIKVSDRCSQYYRQTGKEYSHLVSRRSNESWVVEFTPLHPGNFEVLAGVCASSTDAEDTPLNPVSFRSFWIKSTQSPLISYGYVKVTAFFRKGVRVCRGPDAAHDGVGSMGTIVDSSEFQQYRQQQQQHIYGTLYSQPTHSSICDPNRTYVRWDNGTYEQYNCSNECGPFLLQLVTQ